MKILIVEDEPKTGDYLRLGLCEAGYAGMEPTTLQVADLELDLLRRRVTRAGKRIDLTAKEFGLRELL